MPDGGELDLDLPPAPAKRKRKPKDPLRIYRRNGAESTGPPYGFDDLPGRIDGWRDADGGWGSTGSDYFVEHGILWDDRHPRLATVIEAWRDARNAEWEVGLRVAVYDRPLTVPAYDTWNAWVEAYGADIDEWTQDLQGLFAAVAERRLIEVRPNPYL